MEFEELSIDRVPAYETNSGQIRGFVRATSSSGSVQVALSPTLISSILELISAESAKTALRNARQLPQALQSAADEPAMLQHAANLQLPEEL